MSSQATDTHMAYSLEEFTYKLTNPISRCHKRTSCVLRGLNHAHAPVKHHTQIFKFIIIPMTPRDRWYLPPLFSQPGWGGAGRDHGHSQFYSKHPKVSRKRKKEKTTQAVKATPHINKEGKGTTLVPSNVLQVMCFNSKPGSFLPPFSLMAHSSPTQTPSNILVWRATGRSIRLLQLTQLCDHSWLVLSESSREIERAIRQEPWLC